MNMGLIPGGGACVPTDPWCRLTEKLQVGENGSVTSIFLLFLEGEFIFHILKGVCDHVATPWNHISIFISNKAHI